ncbi:MAG: hypothetical protein U1A78_41465 [Polyangia bacterium]
MIRTFVASAPGQIRLEASLTPRSPCRRPNERKGNYLLDIELWTASCDDRWAFSILQTALPSQISFVMEHGSFVRAESAAEALLRLVLAPPPPDEPWPEVSSARVSVREAALPGGTATESVSLSGRVGDRYGSEITAFGTVDIIHETGEAGIYRLNIGPGRQIPRHVHHIMQEAELILTEGLLAQDWQPARGAVSCWPLGVPHGYQNPTARYQSILCIDMPPFIPSDEILIA